TDFKQGPPSHRAAHMHTNAGKSGTHLLHKSLQRNKDNSHAKAWKGGLHQGQVLSTHRTRKHAGKGNAKHNSRYHELPNGGKRLDPSTSLWRSASAEEAIMVLTESIYK